MDIVVIADVTTTDIHYLVTLVDSLEVSNDATKVGVVAIEQAANAVLVKFSDGASSNEEMLLGGIRIAGKGAGYVPTSVSYQDALTRVKELFFTSQYGERPTFRNVLLVFTDATTGFKLDPSAVGIIDELKVNHRVLG